MKYTVYIDVLFFVNLFMDLLILLLLKRLFRLSASWKRLFLGASFGAAWACGTLFFPFPAVTGGLPGLAASGAFMVWLVFERGREGDWRERLARVGRETAGRFFLALVLGGAFYALEEMAAGWFRGGAAGGDGGALGLSAWACLAAGAGFLARFLWETVQEWAGKRRAIFRVRLGYRGRETETDALLDTGNRLISPDGGRPVHVLEYEVCRQICEKVDGVTYIPYRSVGRQDGVIPGITLDYMEIGAGKERTRVERPLIGIVKAPLSPDGSYRMLLNERAGR